MSLPQSTLDAIAAIVVTMEVPGPHTSETLHQILVALCENAYSAGRVKGIEEMYGKADAIMARGAKL